MKALHEGAKCPLSRLSRQAIHNWPPLKSKRSACSTQQSREDNLDTAGAVPPFAHTVFTHGKLKKLHPIAVVRVVLPCDIWCLCVHTGVGASVHWCW